MKYEQDKDKKEKREDGRRGEGISQCAFHAGDK